MKWNGMQWNETSKLSYNCLDILIELSEIK